MKPKVEKRIERLQGLDVVFVIEEKQCLEKHKAKLLEVVDQVKQQHRHRLSYVHFYETMVIVPLVSVG